MSPPTWSDHAPKAPPPASSVSLELCLDAPAPSDHARPRPWPRPYWPPPTPRARGGSLAARRACSERGAPDSQIGSARAFPPLCFKLQTGFFLLLLGGGGPGGSGVPIRPAVPGASSSLAAETSENGKAAEDSGQVHE
ncbi:hypothetical protein MC885_004716 [Smutsia gigantea]|nr:hypothetical protein MC885_004716 [Smutsia gigantea]